MLKPNPFPGNVDRNGFQVLSSTCSEKDILNLASGNLVKQVFLFNIPVLGANPLEFTLTYNAQEQDDVTNTALGLPMWRHNYQMSLSISGSLVVYNSPTGRSYDFVPDGAGWKLSLFKDSGTSHFADISLTKDGSDWLITSYPSLNVYRFDSSGRLSAIEDAHGNALTMGYSSDKLVSVTEPRGRALTFGYSTSDGYDGSFLTSITDPKGNNPTQLEYHLASRKLTEIVGPEGCTITYAYEPSTTLINKRTDPTGKFYEYEYDGSQRLITVKDAESPQNELSYDYALDDDEDKEQLGHHSDGLFTLSELGFRQTKLLDARGKLWKFRFDRAGSLWRVMSPLGRWKKMFTDNRQNQVFLAEGSSKTESRPASSTTTADLRGASRTISGTSWTTSTPPGWSPIDNTTASGGRPRSIRDAPTMGSRGASARILARTATSCVPSTSDRPRRIRLMTT